jgi:hypothetical protein
MQEPSARELRDIDQELKEAVCDAVVDLVIGRVSGGGVEGQVLYGPSPRRSIISGQLLPRFDETGQSDETSDIRIAALGVDFQVASGARNEASATPSFSVYVRVLPNWAELSDPNLGLDPQFKLRTAVQAAIDARIRQLRDQRFQQEGIASPNWSSLTPAQKQDVRSRRTRIQDEVRLQAYHEQGIELQASDARFGDQDVEADEGNAAGSAGEQAANNASGGTDQRLRIGRLLQQGRSIPYALLEPARPPAKWRRIDLALPTFRWALDADGPALASSAAAYSNEVRQAALAQVTQWLNAPEGVRDSWRDLRVQPQDIETEQAWQNYRTTAAAMPVPIPDLLPKLDGLELQIDRVADYLDPALASIRVALDNRTSQLSKRQAATRTDAVFNVRLVVSVPTEAHRPLRLDRVEPSYRFREFLNYPGIGLNCGVTSAIVGELVTLTTTWSPRFVQPRIIPRRINVPTTFAALSDEALAIDALYELPRAYKAWIDNEETRLRPAVRVGLDSREADIETTRLEQDISAQRQEAAYIERGVRLLEESQRAFRSLSEATNDEGRTELMRRAAPYRAWILTNRSFLLREKGDTEGEWHLFQLAFILAHVPTLASRMEEYRSFQDAVIDEDAASLLYFPTGGGKSEAFYGTLLFAMFLDRLRGKERGVTAFIRYPLRLLTLQQGQRVLQLIAHAELVRRRCNVGQWPFEIGFWVGGRNTPNRYSQVPSIVPLFDDDRHRDDTLLEEGAVGLTDEERQTAQKYREFRLSYNKVPNCPVCGAETGLRRIHTDPTARRLGIVCFNNACEFNREHGAPTPLPFLLTDDTIYERAPSVVLGTIDKMAMLGQHTSTIRRLLGMFGLARAIGPSGHFHSPPITHDLVDTLHEDGYQEVFPFFRDGRRVFLDPFPSLIIQDEAHLLEESLGTFSGLFDTLLEQALREIDVFAGHDLQVARIWMGSDWAGPRMPKVIAATATISNPERQLEVLYQRRPLRFPYPGSDIYHSFFACPAPPPTGNPARLALSEQLPASEAPEATAPWMRLFVSLMTNDATHTVTSVAVLSAFHTIISSLWRGLLDPARRTATIATLRCLQQPDVSGGWRQAAIDRAARDNREAQIMALIDLHRVALAYVTNKKGGDQIMDALDAAVRQRHRTSHEPLERFISRLISGGIDMKEIQEIMEQAKTANPGQSYPEIDDRIRSIVATSAISHGVDVDRFNSMFFAGLPSDIAEYIQASSRVGRTHVGFVMLIPTPQNRRDRYVVETHDIFHRFLERMIAPPAVERWAENAIRRVMASLAQTWALLRENELFIEASASEKRRADSYDVTSPVSAYARRDVLELSDDFGTFALRAIGFEGRGSPPRGRPVYDDIYRDLVRQEVDRFAQHLRNISSPLRFQEYWAEEGAAFKPPMTSLRDVDEAGIIVGGGFDMYTRQGSRRVRPEHLIHVMRAIRSQRGAVAEIDQDAPEDNQP